MEWGGSGVGARARGELPTAAQVGGPQRWPRRKLTTFALSEGRSIPIQCPPPCYPLKLQDVPDTSYSSTALAAWQLGSGDSHTFYCPSSTGKCSKVLLGWGHRKTGRKSENGFLLDTELERLVGSVQAPTVSGTRDGLNSGAGWVKSPGKGRAMGQRPGANQSPGKEPVERPTGETEQQSGKQVAIQKRRQRGASGGRAAEKSGHSSNSGLLVNRLQRVSDNLPRSWYPGALGQASGENMTEDLESVCEDQEELG